MQERGYEKGNSKLLSRTAGEGWWVRVYVRSALDKAAAQSPTARLAAAINRP